MPDPADPAGPKRLSSPPARSRGRRLASLALLAALGGLAFVSAGCAAPPDCVTGTDLLKQDHSTFNRLLASAGVDTLLCEGGPYTLFAPTDEAFAQLPPDRLAELSQPDNHERLRGLLLSHVVKGELSEQDLAQRGTATTASGKVLTLTGSPGHISVEQAVIEGKGAKAKNGVVYSINSVLQPQ